MLWELQIGGTSLVRVSTALVNQPEALPIPGSRPAGLPVPSVAEPRLTLWSVDY